MRLKSSIGQRAYEIARRDRPGRHQRWTRTRVTSPVAASRRTTSWYCRPVRGLDRRPSWRPRTGPACPVPWSPAWVGWGKSYCPLIHQMKCYIKPLKSYKENVRPQCSVAGQALRPAQPPCISHLSAGDEPARLMADGSPSRPRAEEPVSERGAPSAVPSWNPNSRLGRDSRCPASPHLQGRVMDHPPRAGFVGIDVSKDRLDVHRCRRARLSPCARRRPRGAGRSSEQLQPALSCSRRPEASRSPSRLR